MDAKISKRFDLLMTDVHILFLNVLFKLFALQNLVI